MTSEFEIRKESEMSGNRRSTSKSVLQRAGTLFHLGFSLGFVLFVALTTLSLMDRGTHLAWASWQILVKEDEPKDLLVPVLPSVRKAQPYRPVLLIQKPRVDYEASRERRLLLNDVWSRFNQTLSTARSFAR
jgi:hypothetical protein